MLGFLKDSSTPENWYVDERLASDAEAVLRNLLSRYQKVEKAERVGSREFKESNILSNEEINRILMYPGVKNVLEKAADSLEKEELRPVTKSGYNKLRDNLITSLLVRSLRTAQQFQEFTVGQEGTVVKIRKHKTMNLVAQRLCLTV